MIAFGTIAYAILFIFTYIFFLERTAILDAAFHLFYILKDNDFAIQVHRFGACFTQIFPLLGSKLGLGLDAIMKLYSVGFICYHFAIFILSILISRSYKFGLVALLFNTLLMTHTHYWIQSELIQGIGFLILSFAFFFRISEDQLQTKLWLFPVLSLVIFNLAFIHPLVVFPFLFMALFFTWEKTINRQLMTMIGSSFIAFYVIKTLLFKSAYDARSMENLDKIWSFFPNILEIPANTNFIHYLIQD